MLLWSAWLSYFLSKRVIGIIAFWCFLNITLYKWLLALYSQIIFAIFSFFVSLFSFLLHAIDKMCIIFRCTLKETVKCVCERVFCLGNYFSRLIYELIWGVRVFKKHILVTPESFSLSLMFFDRRQGVGNCHLLTNAFINEVLVIIVAYIFIWFSHWMTIIYGLLCKFICIFD